MFIAAAGQYKSAGFCDRGVSVWWSPSDRVLVALSHVFGHPSGVENLPHHVAAAQNPVAVRGNPRPSFPTQHIEHPERLKPPGRYEVFAILPCAAPISHISMGPVETEGDSTLGCFSASGARMPSETPMSEMRQNTPQRWLEAQIKGHPLDGTSTVQIWQQPKLLAFRAMMRRWCSDAKVAVDLGCYTGVFSRAVFEGVPRLIGYDMHPEALAVAKQAGLETHHVDLGGSEPGPLPAGIADVVMSADVIEHLIEPRNMLKEAQRLLRPGGVLLLSTPNLAYWRSRLRMLWGAPPYCTNGVAPDFRSDRWVDPTHLHVSTSSEWHAFFRQENWTILQTQGAHHHIGGRRQSLPRVLDRAVNRWRPSLSLIQVMALRSSSQH
jgi:2-polyprenyl-3-methyl-5-hydroxy-6-metoxy-1,4-benzoquinol methylase